MKSLIVIMMLSTTVFAAPKEQCDRQCSDAVSHMRFRTPQDLARFYNKCMKECTAKKDPRVDVAKRETAKLYRGHVYHGSGLDVLGYGIKTVNVLEQHDSFFLTQVAAKNKKNFCFILEVDIVDNVPEISVVANNNEIEGVFIRACSDKPTVDELSQFKLINNWPTQ